MIDLTEVKQIALDSDFVAYWNKIAMDVAAAYWEPTNCSEIHKCFMNKDEELVLIIHTKSYRKIKCCIVDGITIFAVSTDGNCKIEFRHERR